jgi:peptidoglycan hydrolase-like protein with peptidoglycan-binding domain
MGPQTRRALKRFQRAHGLKADGIAGPATLAALGLAGTKHNSTFASTQDAATILAKIAQCESGGDIHAVSANGRYFGKYQFSKATWEALGGTGSPADADEATQDLFAARLFAERGTAPWPACSANL